MDKIQLFIDSYELWRDPVAAFLVSGAVLAYLGVWSVLKKAVFIPLAVAQASSLGIVLSFLAVDIIGYSLHPFAASLLFALFVSFYFAKSSKDSVSSSASIYVTASAATLILASFIRADMNDIDSVIFGNAILIMRKELVFIIVSAVFVLFLHILRYKAFLFTSFDSLGASVAGFNPKKENLLLYLSFALMISVTSKSIGAMPVFALMTLPALTGFALSSDMAKIAAISVGCGIFSAAAGYFLSFVFDLPVGASVAAIAGVIFVFAKFIKKG